MMYLKTTMAHVISYDTISPEWVSDDLIDWLYSTWCAGGAWVGHGLTTPSHNILDLYDFQSLHLSSHLDVEV